MSPRPMFNPGPDGVLRSDEERDRARENAPYRIVGVAPPGETCDVCGGHGGYAVRAVAEADPTIEVVCSSHLWGR